ncbi:MAG: AAA family ATPase [Desulfuromonadales bacterium]|nr:AAA family ATPase [Desulfuromonadales bacterium]
MKIVACYSFKGGVGKTAAAVNLAYRAAQSGQRTLLIDLDPQGASSFYFRVRPEAGSKWKKQTLEQTDALMGQIRESDYSNLDLIPAQRSLRNLDILLKQTDSRETVLRRLLKKISQDYDLILLDCPPSVSRLAENIFVAADLILVPVIPTPLSERTYDQLVRFFKDKDYDRKKLLPFFSMVDARKQLHRDTALGMRQRYKRILRHAIPYSTDVERMGVHRAPLDLFARGRQANRAYLALWEEVELQLAGIG